MALQDYDFAQGNQDTSKQPSVHSKEESLDCIDFHHPLNPAVTWFDGSTTEIDSLADLLALADEAKQTGRRAVCLVEDITQNCVEHLVDAWHIDPSFFHQHFKSPHGNAREVWTAIFPEDRHPIVDHTSSKYKHIDGMLEYHYLRGRSMSEITKERVMNPRATHNREFYIPAEPYSPFSHTMISYCRVSPYLCRVPHKDTGRLI